MREALLEGAASLSIELTEEVVDLMCRHFALLTKWAKKMNLTAIDDPVDAARLHYLDSLLFAELIDEEDTSKTVDVGSGAGFPGIPLALVRPRLEMTLMEPIRKRASFLSVALADLGLTRVRVECMRLEDAQPYELYVSRATIPPRTLATSVRGRLVMTSGAGAPEIAELPGHRRRITRRLPGGHIRILDELEPG